MENQRYADLSFPPPFSRPDAQFWGENQVQLGAQRPGTELTGESAATRGLRLRVTRVGPYFRSALVSGETGTGKARVAAALHEIAAAKDGGAFVTCELPMLEAAAAEMHAGSAQGGGAGLERLVDAAAGGTLFFESIGEASYPAQSLLLRAMEQWDRDRRSNRRGEIRVIASSHEDLKTLVSAGTFRQELYERLGMVQLRVAPLRERMEDVMPLAVQFLKGFAELYARPARELGEGAVKRLLNHTWPGNVRELESAIRGAVLEAKGAVIEARDLPIFGPPREVRSVERISQGPVRLQDVIDAHVLQTLRQCAGNKLRAAEVLGVSRSTLYRMLEVASAVPRMEDFESCAR